MTLLPLRNPSGQMRHSLNERGGIPALSESWSNPAGRRNDAYPEFELAGLCHRFHPKNAVLTLPRNSKSQHALAIVSNSCYYFSIVVQVVPLLPARSHDESQPHSPSRSSDCPSKGFDLGSSLVGTSSLDGSCLTFGRAILDDDDGWGSGAWQYDTLNFCRHRGLWITNPWNGNEFQPQLPSWCRR